MYFPSEELLSSSSTERGGIKKPRSKRRRQQPASETQDHKSEAASSPPLQQEKIKQFENSKHELHQRAPSAHRIGMDGRIIGSTKHQNSSTTQRDRELLSSLIFSSPGQRQDNVEDNSRRSTVVENPASHGRTFGGYEDEDEDESKNRSAVIENPAAHRRTIGNSEESGRSTVVENPAAHRRTIDSMKATIHKDLGDEKPTTRSRTSTKKPEQARAMDGVPVEDLLSSLIFNESSGGNGRLSSEQMGTTGTLPVEKEEPKQKPNSEGRTRPGHESAGTQPILVSTEDKAKLYVSSQVPTNSENTSPANPVAKVEAHYTESPSTPKRKNIRSSSPLDEPPVSPQRKSEKRPPKATSNHRSASMPDIMVPPKRQKSHTPTRPPIKRHGSQSFHRMKLERKASYKRSSSMSKLQSQKLAQSLAIKKESMRSGSSHHEKRLETKSSHAVMQRHQRPPMPPTRSPSADQSCSSRLSFRQSSPGSDDDGILRSGNKKQGVFSSAERVDELGAVSLTDGKSEELKNTDTRAGTSLQNEISREESPSNRTSVETTSDIEQGMVQKPIEHSSSSTSRRTAKNTTEKMVKKKAFWQTKLFRVATLLFLSAILAIVVSALSKNRKSNNGSSDGGLIQNESSEASPTNTELAGPPTRLPVSSISPTQSPTSPFDEPINSECPGAIALVSGAEPISGFYDSSLYLEEESTIVDGRPAIDSFAREKGLWYRISGTNSVMEANLCNKNNFAVQVSILEGRITECPHYGDEFQESLLLSGAVRGNSCTADAENNFPSPFIWPTEEDIDYYVLIQGAFSRPVGNIEISVYGYV